MGARPEGQATGATPAVAAPAAHRENKGTAGAPLGAGSTRGHCCANTREKQSVTNQIHSYSEWLTQYCAKVNRTAKEKRVAKASTHGTSLALSQVHLHVR